MEKWRRSIRRGYTTNGYQRSQCTNCFKSNVSQSWCIVFEMETSIRILQYHWLLYCKLSFRCPAWIPRNQNKRIGQTFGNSGKNDCVFFSSPFFIRCKTQTHHLLIYILFQMVLPNLTTNTFYEVKVRAASISTINPRQVILGSYSEPQKVIIHVTHHCDSSFNQLINYIECFFLR